MKGHDLESMSVDELWSLHQTLVSVLASKISTEKARLERRLRQIGNPHSASDIAGEPRARRPYPPVFPKFRNPARPSETWAGRGKQPRWLTVQLKSGKQLDDFRIQTPSEGTRRHAKVVAARNRNKKTAPKADRRG